MRTEYGQNICLLFGPASDLLATFSYHILNKYNETSSEKHK